MALEDRIKHLLGDDDPKHLGSGWVSGVGSVILGAAALLAVICFYFPELLTTPELREVYPMEAVRTAVEIGIGVAFLLGLMSATVRRRKVLGWTGMVLALAAGMAGGGSVAVDGPVADSPYLGLDWFVLSVLTLCVVFVPLEKAFPLRKRGFFRAGWATDGVYFMLSHLLVQVTALLTLAPATVLFGWARNEQVAETLSSWPFLVQFALIVLVADLAEYIVHRCFHQIPFLWPFHEIHHSSREMDWLAGSRLHIVDIVMTRGLTFLPIFLLGFDIVPMVAYAAFVSVHAVFIHANVRLRFGPLEHLVASPHFHHWHHADDAAAVDKNFAVHLPLIDRAFGTYHAPAKDWPGEYGVSPDRVPDGYVRQLVSAFRNARATRGSSGKPSI